MRAPLLPVRLPADAAADVRVIDDAVTGLAAALCHLAAQPIVRLLRDPVQAPQSSDDVTDLGFAVYAESVVLTGGPSQARVLAAGQVPTLTTPGAVLMGVIPAADWLPGTSHPTGLTTENLAALGAAVDRLIALLTDTQHLG